MSDNKNCSDPTVMGASFLFELESDSKHQDRYEEIRKVLFEFLWNLPYTKILRNYPEIKFLGVLEKA